MKQRKKQRIFPPTPHQRSRLEQHVDDWPSEPEAPFHRSDVAHRSLRRAPPDVDVDDIAGGVDEAEAPDETSQVPVSHSLVGEGGRVRWDQEVEGRARRGRRRKRRRKGRRRRSADAADTTDSSTADVPPDLSSLAKVAVVVASCDAAVLHRGRRPRADGRVADFLFDFLSMFFVLGERKSKKNSSYKKLKKKSEKNFKEEKNSPD